MKIEVTKSMFIDAFAKMGRGNNFSYEGLCALYDYLMEFEEGTGEEMELDVIAICCDFTEYADFEEFQNDYSDIKTMEELEDNTLVIKAGIDSFIIQNF